jgi:tRNA(adenine34) deaminase
MCGGATAPARLPRLVYATTDPKAVLPPGSIMDVVRHPRLNHQVGGDGKGVLAEEASRQIRSFFHELRADGQKIAWIVTRTCSNYA